MTNPFPDSRPLSELLADYEVSAASEPDATVYVTTGLSSKVEWIRGHDGVVRMYIDDKEVRDAWWRRVLNWCGRRWRS